MQSFSFLLSLDVTFELMRSQFRDTMNYYDLTHVGQIISFDQLCEDFIDIIIHYASSVGDMINELDYHVDGNPSEYEQLISLSLRDQTASDIVEYIDESEYFNASHPSYHEFATTLSDICADLAYWIARQFMMTLHQLAPVKPTAVGDTVWSHVEDVYLLRVPNRPSIAVFLWLS